MEDLMGVIFTLSPEIKDFAAQIFDDLINELAKPCKVVYPPKMIPCAHCAPDPTGKKSSGFWRDGTRIKGVCPYCSGNYFKAEEISETLYFLTEVRQDKFEKFPFNVPIREAGGMLQIKGYMNDLPAITQCEYLIHDLNMAPFIQQKYKMYGEPISPSNIVKNRYFICLFERV